MKDKQYLQLAVKQAKRSVDEGGFPAGATLYASLQPCLMCFSVAYWSGISRIVIGCRKTEEMTRKGYYEGLIDVSEVNEKNNRKIELVFLPDFEQETLDLVEIWEKDRL